MKRRVRYLVVLSSAALAVLVVNTSTAGAESDKSACLQDQLDQLHAHWHSLATEKDPAVRGRMIQAHRELIGSVGKSAKANESGSGCKPGASVNHHDAENMAEMHTMMLNMIEK